MKYYSTRELPIYTDFHYWFLFQRKDNWSVYDTRECKMLDLDTIEDEEERAKVEEDIKADFERFKKRPEFAVGRPTIAMAEETADPVEMYERLIIGLILQRFEMEHPLEDPDNFLPTVDKLMEWLRQTDFYKAPASTQYHESHVGGLLEHTFKVLDRGLDLIDCGSFSAVNAMSFEICALTHDWCKIGLYEGYKRNVKDDNGNWIQVDAFKREQRGVPLGHGVTSMFLAGKFFKLTVDEALAIRWHQGRWNCCDAEFNELQKANEEYPLVHLLQFADQLAIVKY